MGDRDILEKAIQKAIDNGWKAGSSPYGLFLYRKDTNSIAMPSKIGTEWRELLYDHDFAKALWGVNGRGAKMPRESFIDNNGDVFYISRPNWQIHLSRMVIADDPIEYLGENI